MMIFPRRHKARWAGFTLVELLVVVTIIVILLALLIPAMSRAVYQSQLAVCGTQLRNIASDASTYALQNKRFYPDRDLLRMQFNTDQPAQLKYLTGLPERPTDQRVVFRKAFPDLNKQLNDPLTGQLDLENSRAEWIFTPYNIWWGFRYHSPRGTKVMERLDDRWDYDGNDYDIVASDRDLVRPASNFSEVQTSHTDGVYDPGVCYNVVVQDGPNPWLLAGDITISFWWSTFGTTHRRGQVDNNYVMSDLSVQRRRVRYDAWNRGEMRAVGTYSGNREGVPGHLMYVP